MVKSAVRELLGNSSLWSHTATSARRRPDLQNARMKNMDDLLEKHRLKWSRPLLDGVPARNTRRAGFRSRTPKQRRDCWTLIRA